MNAHDETASTAMVRGLHATADTLERRPFTLDSIQGTATRIRRRRRTGVATVVAAAAAAVALVLVPGGEDRKKTTEVPPAAPVVGLSILHDGVVTHPDGSTVDTGFKGEVGGGWGVLDDGRILISSGKGIRVFDPDGPRVMTFRTGATNLLTIAADGSGAAWQDPQFRTQVLRSGQPQPQVLGKVPGTWKDSWEVKDVRCAEECVALLDSSYHFKVREMRAGASVLLPIPEPFTINDVSADGSTWAVTFERGPGDTQWCVGLVDAASSTVTARSCETNGLAFAPDGQHLLATGGGDGAMSRVVQVLDRDLTILDEHAPAGKNVAFSIYPSALEWWDDNTLVVAEGGWGTTPAQWRLLSFDIGATKPKVLQGPIDGINTEMGSAWHLAR